MGFLSPLYLIGAAAAVIPIVLHLLKRQHEQRVRFAPVSFLKNAPVERTSRRRLREWLLLMLRVAALLLLALAFARPFLRATGAAAAGTTVVMIDTSFSMSAPGRFERAKALARDAIRQTPASDDVAVVRFADQADVVVRPTGDRGAALAAIDAVRSGFGATKYRSGLNTATSLVAGRRAAFVIVTDLQENGWDAGESASVSTEARVEIRDVGALPDNLAVTALRVDGGRAIATIRNESRQGRQIRGRLSVDGKTAAEASAAIAANESADLVFPLVNGATAVSVAIEDTQGLQADNVRYALVSRPARPSVLVATATGDPNRDAFYVEHALAAGRTGDAPQVTNISAARLSTLPLEQLRRQGAVLLLGTRGLEPRGRELLASYVTGGGGLLVAAGPDVDGEVIADVLGSDARLNLASGPDRRRADEDARAPLALAPADVRHPIVRAFGVEAASLGLVTFRTTARIGGPTCTTLAKFTSGDDAIIDCAAGDGHALVVGSDLNNRWNDFPLRASFVPFVHEALRYLSSSTTRATEYVVGDVPSGVAPVPGVVDARGRRVVVNIDPRESEPARISADEFQAAVTRLKDAAGVHARTSATEQEAGQHLWQFLLVSAIITLAVEGMIAARSA
jgi:Aerotolerance regulator N-terminal/von Willebrand factor type A domain